MLYHASVIFPQSRGQESGTRRRCLQVVAGTSGTPTATVRLQGPDGMPKIHCSVGTGPVDAAYKAVDMALQMPAVLTEYSMQVRF